MLVLDMQSIGNRLLGIRKKAGLTQLEVAELAGLSDRTYADVERGAANMRIETLLRICRALRITPDEILTNPAKPSAEGLARIMERLRGASPKVRHTASTLLTVYLDSLE